MARLPYVLYWDNEHTCQEGIITFIFYDHGIREEINDLDLPTLLKVRVALRAPRDNGLPIDEEFEPLKSIEDELSKDIEKIGGIYVGRITGNANRYFYCYVGALENEFAPFINRLSEQFGYHVAYVLKDDPDKKGYWEDLFPTRYDWQVIQDLKVIEQLEEHGDNLETARRVDHWAYFQDLSQLEGFMSWAEREGFTVDNVSKPDESTTQYGIQLFHSCTPKFDEISHYTLLLVGKAEEFGGEYDGWETSVEKHDS